MQNETNQLKPTQNKTKRTKTVKAMVVNETEGSKVYTTTSGNVIATSSHKTLYY